MINRMFSHKFAVMVSLFVLLSLTTVVTAGTFPTEVTSVQYDDVIYIRWFNDYGDNEAVSPFTTGSSFKIDYRTSGTEGWHALATTDATWAKMKVTEPGISYEFRVTHFDSEGIEQAVSNPHEFVSLVPKDAEGENLHMEITSLSADEFPIIYLWALVDSVGEGLFELDEDNFTVNENGVYQDSMFKVYPPESGPVATDIVFVFDATGSMGDEIDALKINTQLFADSLVAAGIDFRIGLIVYYDDYVMYNSGNLVPPESLHVFRGWINDLVAWGGGDGPEDAFDALDAATTMNFRPAAQKFFIVVTDASAHYEGDMSCPGTCSSGDFTNHTQESIVSLLLANDVSCYVIGPDLGNSGTYHDYCGGCYDWQYHSDSLSLTDATGGQWYSILADFRGIVEDMVEGWASQYKIRYHSSNPDCDGVEREVELLVEDFGEMALDTAWYIPCMRPIVIVTDYTRNLEAVAQPFGVALTIDAWVIDNVEPFPTDATLFYRTTGGGGYLSTPMWNVSDSLWRADIPAGVVINPGVDYYITATDGTTTGSAPSADPSIYPYQIAVLPNVAPVITHTSIDSCIDKGVEVIITAEVWDTTFFITAVELYYRSYGEILYNSVAMAESSFTYYSFIPAEVNGDFGFEYYIRAVDNFGVAAYHGDSDFPHRVNIGPCGEESDTITPTYAWIDVYCEFPDFNGVPLAEGDVIKAYDPDGVLCGMDVVGADGTFGFMPIYCDDEYTPDVDEGAEPGNLITFTINDEEVLTDPEIFWTTNGAQFELCSFYTCIELELTTGWNLISWNLDYATNITEFASLLGKCSCLEVILGFDHGALTYDPDLPEYSTLDNVDYYHGYWVKMRCDNTITICGLKIDEAESIQIYSGWNLVSYWPNECLPVETALASIAGLYEVVLGYDGGYQVYVASDTISSTLTEMCPEFGYWIRSTADATLTYPGWIEPPVAVSRQNTPVTVATDFITPTRNWMSIYGSGITLNGKALPADAVIEASTEDGVTCGHGVCVDGLLKFTPVYGWETGSETTSAYPKEGDLIQISVNGERVYPDLVYSSNGDRVRVERLTSAYDPTLPLEFTLSQNYPNPFNPTTVISFNLPKTSQVKLTVFNVLGQEVATLVNDRLNEGPHTVTWTGTDNNGNTVSSGLYLYRLTAGDKSLSKKMVLTK